MYESLQTLQKNLHIEYKLQLKDGRILTLIEIFDCLSQNLLYIAICDGCREFYLGETPKQVIKYHRYLLSIDSKAQ